MRGGGIDYAFSVCDKQNLIKIQPKFAQIDFRDRIHSKSVDLHAIKLIQELKGIQLYSLAPNSPLSEIVPLADTREHAPMKLEAKPDDFTCDILPIPSCSSNMVSKLKQFGLSKDNIYVKLLLDFKILLKAVIKAMIK